MLQGMVSEMRHGLMRRRMRLLSHKVGVEDRRLDKRYRNEWGCENQLSREIQKTVQRCQVTRTCGDRAWVRRKTIFCVEGRRGAGRLGVKHKVQEALEAKVS